MLLQRGGTTVARAHRGAELGGLEMLARSPAQFTAVAETETLALELTAEANAEMLDDHFGIFHSVLRQTCREIIDLHRRMPQEATRAMPQARQVTVPQRELDLVERIFFLRQAPPFARSSINALAELSRSVAEVHFDPGTVLWSEGFSARGIFLVVSGLVRAASPRFGYEMNVGAGQPLGILEAFAQIPRWYEATVVEPTVVLYGRRRDLRGRPGGQFRDGHGLPGRGGPLAAGPVPAARRARRAREPRGVRHRADREGAGREQLMTRGGTMPRRTAIMGAMLAMAAAGFAADARPVTATVFLAPIGEDVVSGLESAKVEASLRKKLAGKKTVSLAPSAEEATIVLRVTECLAWSEKRRVNEWQERPAVMPTEGGGVAEGNEGVYGARTETRSQVALTVRASWGERFLDLQSSDTDSNLQQAVDSVAGQLDRLVKKGLRDF